MNMSIKQGRNVDFGYNRNKITGALHGEQSVYAFLRSFSQRRSLNPERSKKKVPNISCREEWNMHFMINNSPRPGKTYDVRDKKWRRVHPFK
jgi:hypothetical protein